MLPAQLLESFSFDGTQADLGKMSTVDIKGRAFQQARRIQTLPEALGEYNVTAIAPVVGPVKRAMCCSRISGCDARLDDRRGIHRV